MILPGLVAALWVVWGASSSASPVAKDPVAMPSPVSPPGPPLPRASVSVDDFEARVDDDGQGHQLPYRLFVPRGMPANARGKDGQAPGAAKYPLVLFLHGAGGRGTDNRGQLTDQDASLVFVQPKNQQSYPLFMVAPQCPPDQQWVDMRWGESTGKGKQPKKPTWPMAAALALVDKLQAEYPAIDRHRLYVTGMSMGGYGSWDAAVRQPNQWKAAVIICGGYDELAVAPLIAAHLPVWAFHAADDPAVPVSRSREMIAALRKQGGSPRYTEYPASAHYGHFSWRPAYSDPQLLPWMFGAPRPPAGAGGPPVKPP